jgi:hypothetical protein
MVEAFFHARFFLEMAVRYAHLEQPPNPLPSGYAGLLYLSTFVDGCPPSGALQRRHRRSAASGTEEAVAFRGISFGSQGSLTTR